MSTVFNPTDQFSSQPNATKSTTNNAFNPFAVPAGESVAGYQLPDYSKYFQNQGQNASNLLSGQANQTGQFLGNYAGAITGQETQPAMYQRIATELGIPALQANAQNLQQQVANIPYQTTQNMKGFDVNNNQLNAQMGMQQWKLAPLAERATQQSQYAQGLLGQQMGYTQAQQAKELLPYQAEQQLMSDYQARQASMFTSQNEQELSALNQKMQTGATLSSNEQERLNQLNIAKQDYQNKLDTARIAQMFQKLDPSQGLYNAITGQITPYSGK
jgi:hypothetical protein